MNGAADASTGSFCVSVYNPFPEPHNNKHFLCRQRICSTIFMFFTMIFTACKQFQDVALYIKRFILLFTKK